MVLVNNSIEKKYFATEDHVDLRESYLIQLAEEFDFSEDEELFAILETLDEGKISDLLKQVKQGANKGLYDLGSLRSQVANLQASHAYKKDDVEKGKEYRDKAIDLQKKAFDKYAKHSGADFADKMDAKLQGHKLYDKEKAASEQEFKQADKAAYENAKSKFDSPTNKWGLPNKRYIGKYTDFAIKKFAEINNAPELDQTFEFIDQEIAKHTNGEADRLTSDLYKEMERAYNMKRANLLYKRETPKKKKKKA